MRLEKIDILTNGSGAFTGYTQKVDGLVQQIRYVPDGTSPLDTGADLTIAGETTGQPILTASNIGTSAVSWAPRQPTVAVGDASASLYAAGGEPVEDRVGIAAERISVVVAQGGAAKLGTLYLWLA